MSAAAGIAVVLPPRERFRPADAGAVALTVRDFTLASRYRDRITILGGETEPYADVPYVHCAPVAGWLLGKNRGYGLACARWLKHHPEARVVEVHNRIPLALQLKQAAPDLRVCVHLHNDPHGMDGARTPAERQRLLERLDAVYCVSGYVRARLLDGVAAGGERAHVVYNALPDSAESEPGQRQPWIVYGGRFIPEKGVLELARALAEILPRFPAWRAVFLGAWGFGHVAGRSDYEQQVYAALAGVGAQVEFRGHVPQTEVMAVLGQSSVAVIPSTCGEAFGRAALEAMATGNAVLVSNFGALPETAGQAALVVPEVSPAALAAALESLLADPARIAAVAARCRRRAREDFALSAQVGVLDAIRQSWL